MASASPLNAPLLPGANGDGDGNFPRATSQPIQQQRAPQEILIEETTRADGSLFIKASTTTPQPNGYCDVKTDHYTIPASAVDATAPPGTPPPLRSDYLTRVEYRVLPPGAELARETDDASTVYTTPPPSHRYGRGGRGIDGAASVASAYARRRGRKQRYRTLAAFVGAFVFFVAVVGVAFIRDYDLMNPEAPPKDTPEEGGDTSNSDATPDDGTPTLTPDASVVPQTTKDEEDELEDEKNATSSSLDPEHNSSDYHLSIYLTDEQDEER